MRRVRVMYDVRQRYACGYTRRRVYRTWLQCDSGNGDQRTRSGARALLTDDGNMTVAHTTLGAEPRADGTIFATYAFISVDR